MPELQRPAFLDRASGEIDRLVSEARSGARGAEEVMGEYWDNIQRLVDDLLTWVSHEVSKVASDVSKAPQALVDAAKPVTDRVVPGAKQAAKPAAKATTEAKQAAKKKPAKKSTAKKGTAKKSSAKKSTATKSTAKKSSAKKSSAKKPTAKKSAATKKSAKK
jgi:hypothetical protein